MPDTNSTNLSDTIPALPVRAVTLFSAGVAYFLREGTVAGGTANVALTFRTTQINDLLKSLVLMDDGGTVQAVTYPSRDPASRTLQAFAVDVTQSQSRADILRQLRGTPVEIETTGGEMWAGRVVGVEEREEVIGEHGTRTVTTEVVTLSGDDGMVSVGLDKVRKLKIADARLDREFREALQVLASSSDDARRTVALRFSGETERTVRVGYLLEAPLWKISYRLVLDDEKPYLQGWALVENTTDDDWNDISLSLVSGRPVSFIQDLYQPLYVPRPVVPPDVIASPFPQTHDGSVSDNEMFGSLSLEEGEAAYDMAPAGGGGRRERSVAFAAAAAPAPMMAKRAMRASAPAQAEGKGMGELFEYAVSSPVSLPRQQAAMIPVVSETIGGEKLSLYNTDRDVRFPMNAFRLDNTTALHLKAGPITLFDGGNYAGEARMEDIPPGDNRLLTYAVDLAVACERQNGQGTLRETAFRIRRGVLTITQKQTQETRYTFKNKAIVLRRLLVEHPFDSRWSLVAPTEPAERTPDWYRFLVTVPPGGTASLLVQTEQPLGQTVALVSGDINALSLYADKQAVPDALKAVLADVVARRQAIATLEADADLRDQERDVITTEQERIRANMTALANDSALYRRYVDELDRQETRLQELRTETQALRANAQTLQMELQTFLDGLDV